MTGMPRVLVTGASSGVGRSLTHHLAERFEVIAVARRGDVLEAEFGATETVSSHVVDLADQGEVERFSRRLADDLAPIPYAVNNAGVNHRAEISALPIADLKRSLQVNALAPLRIMQALLPGMRERGFGRIVNVTSGAPLNNFPGFGAYSGSKALLNALTVTAAREHEHDNIKINLMSPGPVRSEMAPDAELDPSACHPTADYLLGLDAGGPSGRFFWLGHEVPLTPDLDGVDWLAGEAHGRLRRLW